MSTFDGASKFDAWRQLWTLLMCPPIAAFALLLIYSNDLQCLYIVKGFMIVCMCLLRLVQTVNSETIEKGWPKTAALC